MSSLSSQDAQSMSITKQLRVFTESTWQERDFVRPLFAILAGLIAVLVAEIACALLVTHGHFVYPATPPTRIWRWPNRSHRALTGFIPANLQHRVRLFFIRCFSHSCSLSAWRDAAPCNQYRFHSGHRRFFLLARECRVPLDRIPILRLILVTAVVAVALDLPGLAILGIEHSLHIAMTVAYLVGLVRFVRRGRCDWWWLVCILIQPIIRFEAAGMLVADALIFVAFRRYGYALATLAIGLVLVGGYSLPLFAGSAAVAGFRAFPLGLVKRRPDLAQRLLHGVFDDCREPIREP